MKLNIYDVIKKPLITEKSSGFESLGKYAFLVRADSNKVQIKKAVEGIFKVKIKRVNIINVHGKSKIFKNQKGNRPGFKKAIITTQDMKKLNL